MTDNCFHYLFLLGKGDMVMCWSCGVKLKGWEKDDDPWTEHKKWSPRYLHSL